MSPETRFRLEDMRGFADEALAPELPWREAVGLRDILIHGYGQIRLDIVVDTIREHFPGLVAALDKLLGGDPP
jgi:uncharacterized protein with HEPN domain